MKRFVIIFSTVLFAAASFKASAIKRVEIEPRMGYSLSVESGAHAAMLVGLPLSEKFSLRGGLYYSKTDFLDLLVPIYASFQIPLSPDKLALRLEGGVFSGSRTGLTATAGFDISNVFVGASYFHNMVNNNKENGYLGVSLGYRFKL